MVVLVHSHATAVGAGHPHHSGDPATRMVRRRQNCLANQIALPIIGQMIRYVREFDVDSMLVELLEQDAG